MLLITIIRMTKSQLGLEISDSESSDGGSSDEETPSGPVIKTLNCSYTELSDFDGAQYEEGMTWDEWFNSDYCPVVVKLGYKFSEDGNLEEKVEGTAARYPLRIWRISNYVRDGFTDKNPL